MNKFNSNLVPPPPEAPSVLLKGKSAYKLWHEYLNKFPKLHRYTLGAKIDSIFIEVLEYIFRASFATEKGEKVISISNAISKLNLLNFFLQIAWENKYLDHEKYALLGERLGEIGKMLGGWRKQLLNKTPADWREKR
jgi:hypothetical protein